MKNKQIEEWRDVVGYEGLYKVSNIGRVKSLPKRTNNQFNNKEIILKPYIDRMGCVKVILTKDKKQKNKKVHRLVADAFIPNEFNFKEINHKDENRSNNNVANLEWCDRKYNNNYGTGTERVKVKLMKKVICIETGVIYDSEQSAYNDTNIKHIGDVCKKRRNTAGGFHWEFYSIKEKI